MNHATHIAATTAKTTLLGVSEARNALAKIHPEEHHLLLLADPEDLATAQSAGIPAVSVPEPTLSGTSRADLELIRAFGCDVAVLYPHTREGYAWGLETAVELGDHKVSARLIEWSGDTEARFSLANLHADATSDLKQAVRRLPALLTFELPLKPEEGFFHPKMVNGTPFMYPRGYALGGRGVYREDSTKGSGRYLKTIALQPMWLDEVMEDLDSQEYSLRLCATEAEPRRVPRGELMDTTQLKGMAKYNFPVTSVGTTAVVQYLERAESMNRGRLKVLRTISKMGWRGGRAFSWGTTQISPKRDTEVLPSPAAKGNEEWYTRHHAKGDASEWASILGPLSQHHVPTILLLASMASVLLPRLKVASAIFETVSETSSGKTSSQTIAQSVWGYGHEDELPSWNSTTTGAEVLLACHNHLPLVLNENKSFGRGASAAAEQARFAYSVVEGTGKVRAQKDLSLRKMMKWNLNVLASGEHSITSGTQDSGIVVRVFPLWSPPFGAHSTDTGRFVKSLVETVCEHYGHAGPMMVRYLMSLDDEQWEGVRQHHRDAQDILVQRANGTPQEKFSVRMAQNWGVLWVAATLLERLFPGAAQKGAYHEAILRGWNELMTRSGERSYSERALDVVRGFIAQMRDHLQTDHKKAEKPVGRIARTRDGTQFVGFIKEPLQEAMERAGLSLDTACEHWENAGYLLGKDRPTKLDGNTVRLIAIRQDALDLEEADDVDAAPPPPSTLGDCPF